MLAASARSSPYVEERRKKCVSSPDRGLALIQMKNPSGGVRPISKQNVALIAAYFQEEEPAHFQEEEPALLGESVETHSRSAAVSGPAKPPSKDDIRHMLGIAGDNLCPAKGDYAGAGCAIGCNCGWWKQCYPKTMLVVHSGHRSNITSQDAGSQVQVGICDLAPPVLVILSVFIMLGAILFFAVVRFVAMLPGHYGLEPKHREVNKPQRPQGTQGESMRSWQGWRNSRPHADDLRRFQDDETDSKQEVEVRAASSGDAVPVAPNITVTNSGAA